MWTLELFYTNDASMFVVSSPNRCGKTLNRIARARKGGCGWQGTPSTDYSCETGISTWHQALSLLRAELLTRSTTPVVTPPPLKIKGKAFGCFWYLKSQLYQCLPMQRDSECRFKGTNLSMCRKVLCEKFCNIVLDLCTKIKLARPACGNCCIGT